MQSRQIIHHLLHRALVDIRLEGERIGSRILISLADLLSDIPLGLERVAEEEDSLTHMLATLRQRAVERKLANRIDNALQQSSVSGGSRASVYRLLHFGFVELRGAASEAKNPKAFCLAHLFHNTPLQLEAASEAEISYDDILDRYVGWAQTHTPLWGCESWLEQMIQAVKHSDVLGKTEQ